MNDAAESVIERDLPCAQCGYNLRTLLSHGSCPECGRPISRSYPPAGFRFGTVGAARGALRGVGLLVAALLSFIVFDIVAVLWFRYYYIPGVPHIRGIGSLFFAQCFAAAVLYCAGGLLVVRSNLVCASFSPNAVRWLAVVLFVAGMIALVPASLGYVIAALTGMDQLTIAAAADALVSSGLCVAYIVLVIATRRQHRAFLWWMMCALVISQAFVASCHWLSLGGRLENHGLLGGTALHISYSNWLWTNCLWWLDGNVYVGLNLLTLIGLGLFARTLSAELRADGFARGSIAGDL